MTHGSPAAGGKAAGTTGRSDATDTARYVGYRVVTWPLMRVTTMQARAFTVFAFTATALPWAEMVVAPVLQNRVCYPWPVL